MLVHTDLHYDNILASQRPGQRWVAIDPEAAVGRTPNARWRNCSGPGPTSFPAHAITGLLDTVVENGQLDRTAAIAWKFVRSIDYWLWGLDKRAHHDPIRCQRVASALAPIAQETTGPKHGGVHSQACRALATATASAPAATAPVRN